MMVSCDTKSSIFPFCSPPPSEYLESHVWGFAGTFHVNLRQVLQKGNDCGEKWHYFRGTAWSECLSLSSKKQLDGEKQKKWGVCLRVMSRIQKMQSQSWSPTSFMPTPSVFSSFLNNLKRKLAILPEALTISLENLPSCQMLHWKFVLTLTILHFFKKSHQKQKVKPQKLNPIPNLPSVCYFNV